MRRLRIAAAWITLYLLPSYWTLNWGRLSRWYERNGFFRFGKGEKLKLRSPRILGYDPIQVLEVVGYTPEGCYQLKGEDGRIETHFKWNVEHDFRKVR